MADIGEKAMQSILLLEKEFIHLQEEIKCIDSVVMKHDDAIRALQDLSLTRKSEIKEIATEVIMEFNKTRTAKMQAFAPYFTAVIMSLGGIIVALLYIANNAPK
jgi:hypothetical protein